MVESIECVTRVVPGPARVQGGPPGVLLPLSARPPDAAQTTPTAGGQGHWQAWWPRRVGHRVAAAAVEQGWGLLGGGHGAGR